MSFQQGLSGLNSSSKQLDTIGNNVANSSTVGFKQSQAQFSDTYAAYLAGSGFAPVGTGVKVAAIAQQFNQGNITNTSNPLDTAINGKGFFRLEDQNGAVLYSRNGQFQVDKNGFLVNNQGHKVSGYLPNASGVIVASAPVPLQISAADLTPKPSANVVVGANLNAFSTSPETTVFNPTDPTSYSDATSVTIYDSLGASHIASLYYQRIPINTVGAGSIAISSNTMTVGSTAGLIAGNTVTIGADTYTISAVVDGTTLTVTPMSTAAAAGPVTTNAGSSSWNAYLTVEGVSVPALPTTLTTLTFNTLGQLTSSAIVNSASFTPTAAAAQTLNFDFGRTSQYGGNFGVNTLTQDGYASGRLNGFVTSKDGTLLGHYTNGQSRTLGQVALANFSNPQGLQAVGNNEWVESSTSGDALVGKPGSSSLGVLQTSAVEDSNVDLTGELVNMITAQRIYQANAQTIKAQDQILQTLVNMR